MLEKQIVYCNQKAKIACDGKCEKAWGINSRPRVQITNDDDDYAFLSDEELGIAPEFPGTYEGNDRKPLPNEEKLNKWCCRECERCKMSMPGKYDQPLILKNFNERVYNIQRK